MTAPRPQRLVVKARRYGRKMVTTETGRIELDIPRDRRATFDPQLIASYRRRFPGFDDKIVSVYARGMSLAFSTRPTRSRP
ncbi:transposase-like protein [Angulomicrobium tetraedrale]|uniref:Transposase-like protein n=1 Tax=Ancylobacter tetraedralis TaxID=217068 RepID=A0A839ZF80_9HYPH|nr:transposase-like protein [Ancylobacter tetraedralis]